MKRFCVSDGIENNNCNIALIDRELNRFAPFSFADSSSLKKYCRELNRDNNTGRWAWQSLEGEWHSIYWEDEE